MAEPRGTRTQYKPTAGNARYVFGLRSVTSPPPNPHYAIKGGDKAYDIKLLLSIGAITPDV